MGILSGSLKPGERLVERELAERLGTSLTVIREALVQLETEGLVTKLPNSATHITQLTEAILKTVPQPLPPGFEAPVKQVLLTPP